MTKRIPKKGTPEYRQYWADRALKSDMQTLLNRVAIAAKQAGTDERRALYDLTWCRMADAMTEFSKGHSLTYIEDAQ